MYNAIITPDYFNTLIFCKSRLHSILTKGIFYISDLNAVQLKDTEANVGMDGDLDK